MKIKLLIFFILANFFPIMLECSPFIDKIVLFERGTPYNGDFQEQSKIFGPPQAYDASGIGGSTDVLNIGVGGKIVVGFEGKVIFDGAGSDFVIYENPFYISGSTEHIFLEPAYVFVSSDGDNWTSFTTHYQVQNPPLQYDDNPLHYSGFAGIHPVFSNSTNGIDPLNQLSAGGDWFDLSDISDTALRDGVDIQNICFIKIVDVSAGVGRDSDGNIIPGVYYPSLDGFDIDAIGCKNFRNILSECNNKIWNMFE